MRVGGTIGCKKCWTDLEAKKLMVTIEGDYCMYICVHPCIALKVLMILTARLENIKLFSVIAIIF